MSLNMKAYWRLPIVDVFYLKWNLKFTFPNSALCKIIIQIFIKLRIHFITQYSLLFKSMRKKFQPMNSYVLYNYHHFSIPWLMVIPTIKNVTLNQSLCLIDIHILWNKLRFWLTKPQQFTVYHEHLRKIYLFRWKMFFVRSKSHQF